MLSGLACLAMAEAAHGKSGVAQSDVDRRLADARPDTMDSLTRAGEDLGYVTRLARLAPAQLLELPLPVVIEPAAGEFALICCREPRSASSLAHPLHGFQSVPRADFDRSWDGRALCLTQLPAADFSSASTTAIYRQFLPFAKPHVVALISLAVLSLLAQFLGLASPLFSQVIIDQVFVTFDVGLLNLLLLGMLTVTAFQLLASGLREFLMAHVMRRISSDLQLRFFDHILALPIRTLTSWRVGDFIVRLRENENLLRLVSEQRLSGDPEQRRDCREPRAALLDERADGAGRPRLRRRLRRADGLLLAAPARREQRRLRRARAVRVALHRIDHRHPDHQVAGARAARLPRRVWLWSTG